jgi:hypothetical protein
VFGHVWLRPPNLPLFRKVVEAVLSLADAEENGPPYLYCGVSYIKCDVSIRWGMPNTSVVAVLIEFEVDQD